MRCLIDKEIQINYLSTGMSQGCGWDPTTPTHPRYNYAYLDVSTYTSNRISLDLLISGSPNTVSVYSILPILRVCRRIRYLHAIIKHEIPSENNNVNVSIQELSIYEMIFLYHHN
ncbi:unnamed protein product [Rotaria magnacalcarata]